ncbi:RNA polymerase factor sigma-32 [Candidatus Odyssella acanthamoebae]|uniref:RNA polymerase factor sigma-32 n=1 Tax=Candidatus Odyssella acanthamoebae TaxID=91604 RepID=UPI00094B6C20|nr:RNA polymerase factor sigma-32 [Candidatus Paracaedibacter acanthamoebae]
MSEKLSVYGDHQTQKADLAYVRGVMNQPVLSREKEMELATAWREKGDEHALHDLTKAYSRLVVATATRFRHYGLPIGDLIQEGNVGLMQAAERFEPERDVRFSTYAKWWIRSFIQDYILKNWSIVRTGSTSAQKQLFFNLRRLRAQLASVTTDHLAPQDRQKIADILKVSVREVETMENRLAAHDLSLSNPIGEESHEDWVDTLADEGPSPETEALEEYDRCVRRHWLEASLRQLPIRERQIIQCRHLTDTPLTLEQIGDLMNISKERVRQLETRALRKMKHHLTRNIHDVKDVLW